MKTNKKELTNLMVDKKGFLCISDISRAMDYGTFGFSTREFMEEPLPELNKQWNIDLDKK